MKLSFRKDQSNTVWGKSRSYEMDGINKGEAKLELMDP